MRFSVLASGSKGNACYIETDHSRVLVDAGLSCREIIRRLEILGVGPIHLDALIITHEHQDHIRSAGPISRRFNIPVYINESTMQKVEKNLGRITGHMPFDTGHPIKINDITIGTFTKCHDAADPVGLVVSSNGSSLGIITDAGRSTRLLEDRLRGCSALVIEFNHDEVMLEQGPYPLFLKRRIRGPEGHLSNREAGELLKALIHRDLRHVVLAHLSEKNNHPEKALCAANDILAECGMEDIEILISSQDQPVPMREI